MAYFNAGYFDGDYFDSDFFLLSAGPLPPSGSSYFHRRFFDENWYAQDYFDTLIETGGTFIEVGTSASVSVTGNAGGWTNLKLQQGDFGLIGVAASYAGFSPDPGGILDNDSDPDGDALSHNPYLTPTGNGRPEYNFPTAQQGSSHTPFFRGAGTITVYAGGAFDWTFNVGTPAGIYEWDYGLHDSSDGQEGDVGRVTMEHGIVKASVGVQGFAGSFNFDFQEQGTRALLFPVGFTGDLLLTFDAQGTSASVGVTGNSGSIVFGYSNFGTRVELTQQGFAGSGTFDSFTEPGSSASVSVSGFAGTLDVGTFFNSQGTAGSVGVQGFAGTLLSTSFNEGGTVGSVSASGSSGNVLVGYFQQGTLATTGIQTFEPAASQLLGGQYVITVAADDDRIVVSAEIETIVVPASDSLVDAA